MPVKLRGGAEGSVTFTVKVVLAVAPVLSFTVSVTVKLPAAVGVPETVPVPPVPLETLPAGRPDTE